jgi:MoxR-like ATPase
MEGMMNHVNVIFEGPDGTGKSTLAKEFATALPAMRICHNAMEGYSAAAMAAMAMHSLTLPYDGLASVVQDRSWLSERVYASSWRRTMSSCS